MSPPERSDHSADSVLDVAHISDLLADSTSDDMNLAGEAGLVTLRSVVSASDENSDPSAENADGTSNLVDFILHVADVHTLGRLEVSVIDDGDRGDGMSDSANDELDVLDLVVDSLDDSAVFLDLHGEMRSLGLRGISSLDDQFSDENANLVDADLQFSNRASEVVDSLFLRRAQLMDLNRSGVVDLTTGILQHSDLADNLADDIDVLVDLFLNGLAFGALDLGDSDLENMNLVLVDGDSILKDIDIVGDLAHNLLLSGAERTDISNSLRS